MLVIIHMNSTVLHFLLNVIVNVKLFSVIIES